MKTCIVTGVPGQDGSYLCESLLRDGHKVVGVSRRSSRHSDNMKHCVSHPNYIEHMLDITDASGVMNLVEHYQPSEFYNLAAVTHVHQSFAEPISTLRINGEAVVGILEAIRKHCPSCHFYQASTSELFGLNGTKTGVMQNGEKKIALVQDEETPFSPRSPYAVAKLYAHEMVKMYREAYNLHCSCGILFNHTSPRRPVDFVVRKITNGVAQVKKGLQDKVRLGNIAAYRDIGASADYVEAMRLMLAQDIPGDYVIATGVSVSIEELLRYTCAVAELDFDEVYEHNPAFMRPLEVDYLKGDCSKAKEVLGWEPQYSWIDLVEMMYDNDYMLLDSGVSV